MMTGVFLVHKTQEQMGMGMATECQWLSFSPDMNMEESLFIVLSNWTRAWAALTGTTGNKAQFRELYFPVTPALFTNQTQKPGFSFHF